MTMQPIISKTFHIPFIDNTWCANLADMQLLSKFNNGICFLLCVTEIFSKYDQVVSVKDKKVLQLLFNTNYF